MEYKQIKNLKSQVEDILRTIPQSRNSDITLTLLIWKKYYPQLLIDNGSAVKLAELYKLPREDNVKRVRAQFQNDKKMFWPTDEKVAKARGMNIDEWRVAMGYPTAAGTYTPPSEEIKEYQFHSESSDAIYTVKDLGTGIVCDCPGFQFRANCKHVDEIKGRLNTSNMEMF